MITSTTWDTLIQRQMTTVRLITGSPDPVDTGAARFWLPGVKCIGRAAADDWRFELVDATAWPSYPNPHGHHT